MSHTSDAIAATRSENAARKPTGASTPPFHTRLKYLKAVKDTESVKSAEKLQYLMWPPLALILSFTGLGID